VPSGVVDTQTLEKSTLNMVTITAGVDFN
jgi:hypothetical protein